MRSFALLLLLINIVFLLWQLTLLPWIPWQPTDFPRTDLEVPSPSKLPSLVMVHEAVNPHKLTENSFSTMNSEVTPFANHQNPEKSIKMAETMSEPSQEVKKTFPKDLSSEMKKISQEEPPLLPQTLRREEPIILSAQSVPQEMIPPAQEKEPKEEVVLKKEISLQNNKKSESKMTCFQMGPYSTVIEADKTAHWLRQQQVSAVEVQNRKTQVMTGTWVYLPPFSSQTATLKASSRLTQLGIKDYRIITSGALNNAISLGVYRQQENVNNLLKTLKNAGYPTPQTEKRYKNETTYWLNVRMPNELTSLLKNIEKKFNFSSPIPSNCQ